MPSQEEAPAPRLCHIQKWPDFEGFGFNLHAEKGRVGQYVGKVDDASPAEAAGLKQGDRIIEVNGVNISNENHRQVVARIKAVPDETRLLVVDAEAEAFFKQREQVVRGDMAGVQHLSSGTGKSAAVDVADDSDSYKEKHHEEATSNTSSATTPETVRKGAEEEEEAAEELQVPEPPVAVTVTPAPDEPANGHSSASSSASDSPKPVEKIPKQPAQPEQTEIKTQQSGSNRPPGLNLTAAELRAQLAQRKKFDPKKENMDLRRKFDIVQTL